MKAIKSNKGFIATDFLFSFVLVLGLTFLLFALTFTLSMVEVTQYITFSGARSYMAAHTDPDAQLEQGQLKYSSLVENAVFSPLYTNGWFEIAPAGAVVGVHSDDYGQEADDYYNFYGISTFFKAPVLNISIPMYGSTVTEDKKDGFQTTIGSFLSREPSQIECEGFTRQRWEKIKAAGNFQIPNNNDNPVNIMDNGC